LAINDVQLSSSLTQDGIVKLIVDSVITGNLSLDIRRYGKSKKRENANCSVSIVYLRVCFGREGAKFDIANQALRQFTVHGTLCSTKNISERR